MNIYTIAGVVIVAWLATYGALYLFMRAWERKANTVEPFDRFYQGCHRALLAEVEKEVS